MVEVLGLGGGQREGHTVNIADPVTFKSSLVDWISLVASWLMHPNKPYWTAVFVSVGCLGSSFLPQFLLTAHSTHLQPRACSCHRVDIESPTWVPGLLHPLSSNPNTSKRVRQFQNVKMLKHDSRESLDTANAFYLTVPSRLGTWRSPNILKKLKRI